MNTDFLDTVTLLRGSHAGSRSKFCFREALAMAIEGQPHDEAIPCITRAQSLGIPLNDSRAWRDNAHRTSVMRPALKRMALCQRDDIKDIQVATRLADYAVREFALACGESKVEQWAKDWLDGSDRSAWSAACAAARLTGKAARKEARKAARTAARAARAEAAAWAAAGAADTADTGAVDAADTAGEVAARAAWAACKVATGTAAGATGAEAEAPDVIERHTKALFGIVFDAYGV